MRHLQQAPAIRTTLSIRLLGEFRVSIDDAVVDHTTWRLQKAQSLVKLLALAHGHRMNREQVADWLWPDLDSRAAANNLYRAIHFARRALGATGENPVIVLQPPMLALQYPGILWIDVDAFEATAADARHQNRPDAYDIALALYGGDLLPGDRYEDWTAERRVALHDTYLSLLFDLAELREERGEPALAREALQRILACDPVQEDAHVGLMRLYATAGQQHRALRQYEQLVSALHNELDTSPSAASRRLHQDILEGRFPVEMPSWDDQPPTNLPPQLTSFVGRERELTTIAELTSAQRLVTLTGPGGCGKTRLALQAARHGLPGYSGGIWFVELASLGDPALVPQEVAAAVGIREKPGRDIVARLAEFFGPRQALLILDNCEHLIEACATLASQVLRACPNLKILATSRESLRIPGEVVLPVSPLVALDPQHIQSLESLLQSESVCLFDERARSHYPAFSMTMPRAWAVARICRRLEGIPLAIELAAAHVRSLSVEQIADRLDDAVNLLTRGARTAPDRQQTLRGALDWSYDLLADTERRVFRRLSVFANGCTLEAAEAVCGDENIAAGSILDLLSRLVDKSLAAVDEQQDETRYRLLEPIRQYARKHLEMSGEVETTRARHAAYYVAASIQAETAAGVAGPAGT